MQNMEFLVSVLEKEPNSKMSRWLLFHLRSLLGRVFCFRKPAQLCKFTVIKQNNRNKK